MHPACSWLIMKPVMTLILSVEPCVNVAVSAGSKLSSLRPSKPAPKMMVGSEQEPRSGFEAPTAAAGVAAAVSLETAEARQALAVLFAAAEVAAAIPATAALISSAEASSMSRFCVKMQPSVSSWTSQVLPAPVLSSRLPGAKVPDLRAS